MPARGRGRAWGGDLIVFVGPGVRYLTDPALPGEGVFECFFTKSALMGSIEHFKIQWNPVNMVTNGPKKFGPYYQDWLKFHDLRAVMTNTPYIAFTILFSLRNNRNVDVVVQIFPWLKIFQTSLIFTFLCLKSITIIRDKEKQKSNWFEKF